MKLPIPEIDFDAIGGRTFVLVLGCSAVNSLMKWFDHLDNGSYTAIIIATVGAYVAANAIDKHGQQRADVQKTIAAAQVVSPPSIVEQVEK